MLLIDYKSTLSVTLTEKSSGKKETIIVKSLNANLTNEEIKYLISEAEKFADKDKILKDRIEALH